jgi:hypothetical protein
MRILAVDFDNETTRALNAGDNTNRLARIFQSRSLLDMSFDEGTGSETKRPVGHIRKGAPQLTQCIGNGSALEILDRG